MVTGAALKVGEFPKVRRNPCASVIYELTYNIEAFPKLQFWEWLIDKGNCSKS
jgi:hypothetical protein